MKDKTTGGLLFFPDRREREAEDREILDLFFRRDRQAIMEIRSRYGALCRKVAGQILNDDRDVEECENDAYMRLWSTIPPEQPKSLSAYLCRITRNLALDRYRYNHAAQRSSALTNAFEELEPFLPNTHGHVEAEMDAAELREALNTFLRGCTAEARAFFLRRYWYGESIREIAEGCNVSEAKVKASLFRTRARLKQELTRKGIDV